MVRQIVRRAVLRHQSARQMTQNLNFDIGVRRVQQILWETPHIQYFKRRPTVKMTVDHRAKRVKWSWEYLQWDAVFWKYIVFSDKKSSTRTVRTGWSITGMTCTNNQRSYLVASAVAGQSWYGVSYHLMWGCLCLKWTGAWRQNNIVPYFKTFYSHLRTNFLEKTGSSS